MLDLSHLPLPDDIRRHLRNDTETILRRIRHDDPKTLTAPEETTDDH